MAFKDLREWIDRLDKEGELKRITAQVNWDREIGAITRKVLNQKGPALLFENIKGYQDRSCRKVFTNGLGSRSRVALALGLPKETHFRDMVRHIKERLKRPLNSVISQSGPVKENILRGSEVDLFEFPVPKWHHLDGGRYINTSCSVVTRDPETGDLNVGTYRGMITGKNTIGTLLATTQHWGTHFSKYRERGEEMPVTVVYGWDPVLFMTSSSPVLHRGMTEYEIAGGLRGEPVELVRCVTNDLLVPSWAEIVVEGKISSDPKTFMMEGPFGEYPGYYGGMSSPKPVIRVECITYRKGPIFRGLLEGITPGSWSEAAYQGTPMVSAIAWDQLESMGVPNVMDVWANPVCVGTNIRVRIKKIYRGHAKQVANCLWSSWVAYMGKHVIVVDDDIDIHDEEALEWALAYRVNAAMDDVVLFPGTFGSMLDPSVPMEERDAMKYGQGKWTRVLIDATINWELERQEQYGGERYPPLATEIPPEDQELINKRWKEYGLK